MIVFVNTSITTINLIKKNPHFDFEYIFFNKKNKNIILETNQNLVVIFEEKYLKINNLLNLKKSKKQIYFIGIFEKENIDLIKKLINLELLNYIFNFSKNSLSSLINKIKLKNNNRNNLFSNPIYKSMFTSFYIFDLIYGDLTKLNALNEITGFKMDDLPNSVITLMIDDFWEICRKMDNRDRYSLKMEYSNLVKNAINRYQIKALSCSLVGTDKIIILVKSPYNFSLNDIALKIKNYINENSKYTVTLGLSNSYIKDISYEFLINLLKDIEKYKKDNDFILDNSINFLEKYYYKDLSLAEVANVCNMSDSYFSRKFKEKFNINFSTYLLNIRLEKAKELLKEKNLNIENISEMVGFKDSSYFSKSFKQKYGMAPHYYRDNFK
ncbi:helix-turn-helix domain-containing protein [Fusobacterium polymorphum]|uniref:AraC family transcriptional regulator n=1 Tax=Fusobacterium nucleatum subsp. polymorphum TaxID=76857 RepID=A0A2C6B6V8_FUSNP|nr:helix-turn-helix transcriptional regulator [Fusobacterium polymorphum]PHH99940.1 AraC family transcriptional regulator [Fusobacterium polymorphum]